MDLQKLLAQLQQQADANGDGKLTVDDLASLKDKLPTDQYDALVKKADANGDGKLTVDDIQGLIPEGFDLSDLTDKLGDLGKLGDMFGGKK